MGIATISVREPGKKTRIITAKNFVTTQGMEVLLKSTFNGIQPRPMYHDVTNGIYMGGLFVGAIVQCQVDGSNNIIVGGAIDINDTWNTKRWLDWPYAGGKIYSWKNVNGGVEGYWDPPPPPGYVVEIGALPYPPDTYLNVGAISFNSFPPIAVYGTQNQICQGFYTGVFFDEAIYPQEDTFQLFSIIPLQVPIEIGTLPLEIGFQYNLNIAELLT